MNIYFVLPIIPKSVQFGANRVGTRSGKARFYKDPKAEAYLRTVRTLASTYRPKEPMSGALIVDFSFIMERPKRLNRAKDSAELIPCTTRPDRDNLQKGTQDALSDFWLDDAQIFAGGTSKYYCEKGGQPRIIVNIQQISS